MRGFSINQDGTTRPNHKPNDNTMPQDPKHPNDYPRVQFQITDPAMGEAIQARQQSMDTSTNTVARRDLSRYYMVLEEARPVFTKAEAQLLVDVFNGIIFQPIDMGARLLWAALEDAEEAYFEKHGVKKGAIVKRLHGLSFAEALAVIDAIERSWNDPQGSVESVGLCGGPEVRN